MSDTKRPTCPIPLMLMAMIVFLPLFDCPRCSRPCPLVLVGSPPFEPAHRLVTGVFRGSRVSCTAIVHLQVNRHHVDSQGLPLQHNPGRVPLLCRGRRITPAWVLLPGQRGVSKFGGAPEVSCPPRWA